MTLPYAGNEIDRLREIYPEIPENVTGLKITLELDAVTQIECTFNPIQNKERQQSDDGESVFDINNRFVLNLGKAVNAELKENGFFER